ncbi:WSC-domain-containing protein [Auricularia subglabra TFB-10046 SS5]|nr:WSC-domain-containing protein [Auricularia subglabra TFB-10046 SS5]
MFFAGTLLAALALSAVATDLATRDADNTTLDALTFKTPKPKPAPAPKPPPTPRVVLLYKTFLSLGCWSDDPSARLLHDFEPSVSPLTVQGCIDKCNSQGLALAGLEVGRECFCGNALLNNQQPIGRANCATACDGNAGQACGGENAIQVYLNLLKPFVTAGPPFMVTRFKSWRFLECSQDDVANRQLPTLIDSIPHEQMSVGRCLDACAAGGFSVGALQFAQECWCGNIALPLPKANVSNCNSPCTDEANQFCGGPGFNQIYFLPNATFTS